MQGLFDVALRGLPDGMSGLGRQGAGLLRQGAHAGTLLAQASRLGVAPRSSPRRLAASSGSDGTAAVP